ncbi:MaoC/PaaZ C-terminal domain-containing protein [Paracoccus aerodenitrificans]|uniref:MaoC/PaaZ C-terminal domain-containing protein n=1 Tax=Paracoccus aerodenitrificans TaxID=3017781 RepID=UPI0022F08A29|nr:MaoC/PaaZ C-terminal domain-containing protein [Paracoccus aerodenitrificans]WBU62744.1 MaoC/PaaZ C-terminal domain-containing protein [Paracoccus aerodenitrificans]
MQDATQNGHGTADDFARYDRLLSHDFPTTEHRFDKRDTILYALACGAAADDLDLVWEERLLALPTMATVLAYPGNFYADPSFDIDALHVVHASERIELDQDLPVSGHVTAKPTITAIYDKGKGRGALIVSRREIRDVATGKCIAIVTQSAFARADGGLGARVLPAPPKLELPSGLPDQVLVTPTSPRAAAFYRLLGDNNPLHIDPDFAGRAGFSKPILHGLCSYGHVARKILAEQRSKRIKMMDCRFTAPVFPGEILEIDLWMQGQGCFFRARVADRVVIDNGEMRFFHD